MEWNGECRIVECTRLFPDHQTILDMKYNLFRVKIRKINKINFNEIGQVEKNNKIKLFSY